MKEDAEDERRRKYLASMNSRAPAAQSFNHQHQHQQRTYGDFLDPTDIGNVNNNINLSNAQQQYREFQWELAGFPPDSYGKETCAPNIGRNPAILFNNGFVPRPPGLAAPLLHSGGTSNISLEDAPSLSTGHTGIPTTATSTSEPGRISQPRHGFNGPSCSFQAPRQPEVPGSGQLLYPLGQVDNYSVPNYGAPVDNAGAAPSLQNYPSAIPHFNGCGHGAHFQAGVNAHISFAPSGNVGTEGHSDYTHTYVPHEQPMAYINPPGLTATEAAAFSDGAYSDRAMDAVGCFSLSQFPSADNFESQQDRPTLETLERLGDELRGVGDIFNTPSNSSFPEIAQQNTLECYPGQANNIATGPLFDQQHRPLNSSTGPQGWATPNFTRVLQRPDSQGFHTVASAFDPEGKATWATPFSAIRPASAGAERCATWDVPMENQLLTQRNLQAPQTRSTQPTTMNTSPSGCHLAEGDTEEAPPKERGRRKKKFSPEKKDDFNKRRKGKTVCVRCRCSHAECETLGPSCSYCEKRGLLCATAHFCHLYLVDSILPSIILGGGGAEGSPAATVSNDVDVAPLKRKVDGLLRGFNVRAISADGNLDVVLDTENLRKPLCQGVPNRPSASNTEPTNHSRIANPFKWVQCVKRTKASQDIDVLAKLYRVRSPVTFEYVTKANSTRVRDIQGHEHNGALDEVVRLLCRNLELETWEAFHGRIYNHKDMGRKKYKRKRSKTRKTRKPRARKPSPNRSHPPNVRSLVSDLLILLFALREYFRSLSQDPIKLRVGEFCKRLYCYYFFLQGKPPNRLGRDDLQRLCEELKFGRNEMPSDRSKGAFFTWMGASDKDVLWWEKSIREKNWFS